MENAEFADRLGLETSDAWIRERTGIRRRHIAGERETTSDMALVAGQRFAAGEVTATAERVSLVASELGEQTSAPLRGLVESQPAAGDVPRPRSGGPAAEAAVEDADRIVHRLDELTVEDLAGWFA